MRQRTVASLRFVRFANAMTIMYTPESAEGLAMWVYPERAGPRPLWRKTDTARPGRQAAAVHVPRGASSPRCDAASAAAGELARAKGSKAAAPALAQAAAPEARALADQNQCTGEERQATRQAPEPEEGALGTTPLSTLSSRGTDVQQRYKGSPVGSAEPTQTYHAR